MAESTSLGDPAKSILSEERIGSYRVLQPLGIGGMSSVFRAVHVETGHEVALKVLTRGLARNSTLLQRFLREARSAETLQHANIVTIYDRGIDRGRHYLVLEYVPGGDFHEYIQSRGPLSTSEAVSVVKSVATGLRYAASRGLIHRDIKPSNILRTPAGQIKIIDLGLALQNEFEDERVTREGTTVGTVDYMAPEQARDSRATSIQSDIYSLGCTFYYLMTGVPVYPGGDITDKLTRHAQSPVPDLRDLRRDVPLAISAIVHRMLAKNPEDRFASYDELIAALDATPLDGLDKPPSGSLVPLPDEVVDDSSPPTVKPGPSRASDVYAQNEADSGLYEVMALVELAGEQSDELRDRPGERSRAPELLTTASRPGIFDYDQTETDASQVEKLLPVKPRQAASSARVWIISAAFICVAFVFLAIGFSQFVDSRPAPRHGPVVVAGRDALSVRPIVRPERSDSAVVAGRARLAGDEKRRARPESKIAAGRSDPQWREPADVDPPGIVDSAPGAGTGSRFLPDWARAPVPDHIEGHYVVVRRASDSSDPNTFRSLHNALDSKIGGTVELADEGPHFIDDLRIAGDTRLIRARPGYRPIIRVERSELTAVRKQPAVFVLDRQDVTLDGLDLIVDVRDLSVVQTALFACSGASLTLRNCSITILNRNSAPFAFVRVEDNVSRPTHIRLERTLVRGRFSVGLDLAEGSAEVALNTSVILGEPGPLIRVTDTKPAVERRLFLGESILAGPGPIIERTKKDGGLQGKPLLIRASGSVFGRLRGAGVASVISSTTATEPAASQIDWGGDKNVFVGWKGFLASGSDHIVTIPDLAMVRSTWNTADRESQEILPPWPDPGDPAALTLAVFRYFVSDHDRIFQQVAEPRAGLFEKAIGDYPAPLIPQPVGWAFERPAQSKNGPVRPSPKTTQPTVRGTTSQASKKASSSLGGLPGSDTVELTFDTGSAPWNGDLGAFLEDRLTPRLKLARVSVVGSGVHRFTPVTVPHGLRLEIRVDQLGASEPPSWTPAAEATGPALIELHGGALVLSNVILRHQNAPRLEHLIHVEDGHLILQRCQITAPGSAADVPGNLILFRSPFTRPYSDDLGRPLFANPVDRPVCRLDESVLITGGTALRVELGRGLVALSQCAIAAGVKAVELLPAQVARSRFEADLIMDHCTMASERAIIRLGPWRGSPPGPDRPWLITSRNCAFLAMYERKTRETVLLRADADAVARGTISWQARDDAADVDFFTAAGDGLPQASRPRDIQQQWVQFWGCNHINGHVAGPRGADRAPAVKFREKLRPGRVEPVDLLLSPDYHAVGERPDVGADLGRLGIRPPVTRHGRSPN